MAKRLLTFGTLAAVVVLLAGCTIFGDGNFSVGPGPTQASPGTYQSQGGPDCHWSRLANLGGSFSSVLASDFLSGPDVVTILPSDAGFQSEGCGNWTPLPASGPEHTSFGSGAYAVGINIAPGTYSAPGGNGCYWEEDSNFLWNGASIIANGTPDGPITVTIASDAVAFKVQRCGVWTMSQPVMTNGNCYVSPQGTCYFAGESCPTPLYGLTVEGGDGPITCVQVSTGIWEWENATGTPGTNCLLDPEGNCYVAGEFCPRYDDGVTVEGGDGPIQCVQVATDTFEWENVPSPVAGNCLLDPEGNCYVAGEACPPADYGVTVEGGNGPITCDFIGDGMWEWEGNQ